MDQCKVIELIRDDDSNIVGPQTTLRQAAERLLTSDCELLVITDVDGRLSGVISESSVVRGLLSPVADEVSLPALVTPHVESIRSDLPVSNVLHLFRSSCHSAIAVVDSRDRVCGLLRRRDVMHYLLCGRIDRPHSHPILRPDLQQPTQSPSESPAANPLPVADEDSTAGPAARPHFLRGDAARQRLLRSDDDLTAH